MLILETDRLLLRKFNGHDASFILTLVNNPTWLQYIGDRNIKSVSDALEYLELGPMKSYLINGFGLSMVELKKSRTPIGMCGIIKRDGLDDPDIGFALMPEFTGMGYAQEIASATLDHARKKLGLEKIVAITTAENTASIKLLNKLGLYFQRMVKLTEDAEELMLFTENTD